MPKRLGIVPDIVVIRAQYKNEKPLEKKNTQKREGATKNTRKTEKKHPKDRCQYSVRVVVKSTENAWSISRTECRYL